MEKEKIKEIIAQLKVVKNEKGYSYQKIADMTKEIGDHVSLSTVKRVFADEEHSFRWDTIKPIATVLLGVGFETPEPDKSDPDQPQRYYAVIEGLKSLVEAKGELIATKDSNIAYLKKQLEKQEKFTNRYRLSTIILSVIIGGFFIIDYFNRNIGFLFLDGEKNIFELFHALFG